MIYAAKNKVIDARLGTKQVLKMYLGGSLLYELPVYAVSYTFDNVTSNAPATVNIGGSLSVTLTATSGNKVQANSVVVTMGGNDITSTAYDHSTKQVSISEVTGNVSITAVGRPYDAEVDYLSSSGTQYIDTLTTMNFASDVFVEQRARVAYNVTNVRQLNGTNGWAFWGCSSGNKFDSAAGTSTTSVGTAWHNVSLTFKKDNGKAHPTLYVDGTKVKESSTGTIGNTNDYDIFIFAIGGVNAAAQIFSKEKIASYQILKDNVLVRDFIPVRNEGVGYMYDKVSGQLFGNAGSGAFTYGNDV